MQIGSHTYNSTGHFERLADLVSWTVADYAVDGTAERLVDIDRGLLTDAPAVKDNDVGDYFKGRALGQIAAHIERVKTARPRMTVLVRVELHTKMLNER